MYINFFFSFHIGYIHSFHLSYLGGPIFPFGAPKSRAQWQTYCRTTYTFFIVHHLHSCNLSFPHVYIIFIFPILGSLHFLSWVPTFPFGGPRSRNSVADLLFHLSFPHTHSFHLSYLGAPKFPILGTPKFPFGAHKISSRPQW